MSRFARPVRFPCLKKIVSSVIAASSMLAVYGCGSATGEQTEDMSDVEGYSYYSKFKPEVTYGKIRNCHDGDTCNAELDDGSRINLRLAGIDAPEVSGGAGNKGQPLGREARDFTNSQVKGKRVRIHKIELDPYSRTVAEIFVGNKLINIQLVELGYAEAYKWATWKINKKAYRVAEGDAKQRHKGVWGRDDYESPGEFRKHK
jgi:endonuclease YncB( thermonuclease family)